MNSQHWTLSKVQGDGLSYTFSTGSNQQPLLFVIPNDDAERLLRLAWFAQSLEYVAFRCQDNAPSSDKAAQSAVKRWLDTMLARAVFGTDMPPKQVGHFLLARNIKSTAFAGSAECALSVQDDGRIRWSASAIARARDALRMLRDMQRPIVEFEKFFARRAIYLTGLRAMFSYANAIATAYSHLPLVERDFVGFVGEMSAAGDCDWPRRWTNVLQGCVKVSTVGRQWRWRPAFSHRAWAHANGDVPVSILTLEHKNIWPIVQVYYLVQNMPLNRRPAWLFIENLFQGVSVDKYALLVDLLNAFASSGVRVVCNTQPTILKTLPSSLRAHLRVIP